MGRRGEGRLKDGEEGVGAEVDKGTCHTRLTT